MLLIGGDEQVYSGDWLLGDAFLRVSERSCFTARDERQSLTIVSHSTFAERLRDPSSPLFFLATFHRSSEYNEHHRITRAIQDRTWAGGFPSVCDYNDPSSTTLPNISRLEIAVPSLLHITLGVLVQCDADGRVSGVPGEQAGQEEACKGCTSTGTTTSREILLEVQVMG